jgi:hypothetical protein
MARPGPSAERYPRVKWKRKQSRIHETVSALIRLFRPVIALALFAAGVHSYPSVARLVNPTAYANQMVSEVDAIRRSMRTDASAADVYKLRSDATGRLYTSPYGSEILVRPFLGDGFTLEATNIPEAACARLLISETGTQADRIYVNDQIVPGASGDDAAARMCAGGGRTVRLVFG